MCTSHWSHTRKHLFLNLVRCCLVGSEISEHNPRGTIQKINVTSGVAVVVEWLACLPVTQKIGVRFYLERESSGTSSWINVGREWCCRGWSIEGGTPGGLFRTRDELPRIKKARAVRNVHECESVCAWNKNIVSAPKWLPCLNACMCAVFHCICICMCSN